jgi:putative phosphoesterase
VLIAVVSDTHLPKGRRRIPDACLEQLEAADLILHAGDFTSLDVLLELRAYGPVSAVYGNVDGWDVRGEVPERTVVEAGGARLGMVHDAGPASRRLERMRAAFPGADAVVFGHSHIPLHERAPDGFQIFNPGSPTDRRRQPQHTMGLARVDGEGAITFEHLVVDG